MKNKNHMMIDIETLGTKPGCVVFQIGAVCFNPFKENFPNIDNEPRKFANILINIDDSLRKGFSVEADTLIWWLSDGKAQLFNDLISSNLADPIETALHKLTAFVADNRVGPVWAQGASFDIPLIEAYYRIFGHEIPWKFWDVYDSRTIFNVAGVKVKRSGTAHHALDDAVDQARSLQKLFLEREKRNG